MQCPSSRKRDYCYLDGISECPVSSAQVCSPCMCVCVSLCVWGYLFPLLLGPCRGTPLEEHHWPVTVPCLLLLREEEGLLRGEKLGDGGDSCLHSSAFPRYGESTCLQEVHGTQSCLGRKPLSSQSPGPHFQGLVSSYHVISDSMTSTCLTAVSILRALQHHLPSLGGVCYLCALKP